MASDRIRILCVDDHRLLREGVTALIAGQRDMKVVASAATGEEAVILFKQFHPDVTLMDLQLPGMSGLDAIRAIRHEDAAARIIVLTMYDGEEDIHRALQEGAATYLLKDMLFDDLAARIRIVKQGDLPLPPKVGARLAQRESHRHLSPRETEVIELIVQGLRNKEIAAALNITENTVQVHLRNLFTKLDVHDRTAALRVALHRGLIHMPRS